MVDAVGYARASIGRDLVRHGQRAGLIQAELNLGYTTVRSPIDGIVTRRNIQEGETAIIGTMNNPGTVIMTIADLIAYRLQTEHLVQPVSEGELTLDRTGSVWKVSADASAPSKSGFVLVQIWVRISGNCRRMSLTLNIASCTRAQSTDRILHT